MVTSALERSLMPSEVVFPARAGFWLRGTALFVDLVLVGMIFQVIAIVAYNVSGGRIQSTELSGIVISRTLCQSLSGIPLGIDVPADFGATDAIECAVTIAGYPTSHTVTVGRQADPAAGTTEVSLVFMFDNDGKPVDWPSPDILLLPAFFIWRCWSDRRRGSLGRRLLGVRLVSAGGTDSVPLMVLLRRYALYALPVAPLWLTLLYPEFDHGSASYGATIVILAGAIVFNLALTIVAATAIVQRNDAFYDRFAGTRVMHTRPNNEG